ncbi:MAG TPA: DUF885 family protein, partial [Phenylobacterium sp.]|nr:DUF885 family protein [Phenylobacterium sp.]
MPLLLDRRLLMAFGVSAALPLGAARAQNPGPSPVQSGADAEFDALAAAWLESALRGSPITATLWGDHRFDHQLDDLTPQGWAARRDVAANLLERLSTLPAAQLSAERQVDAAILRNTLAGDVWTHDTLRAHRWDPLILDARVAWIRGDEAGRPFEHSSGRTVRALVQAIPQHG